MSLWHPGRHEQDMGNDVTNQLQIVTTREVGPEVCFIPNAYRWAAVCQP